jgi:hypothetical protein
MKYLVLLASMLLTLPIIAALDPTQSKILYPAAAIATNTPVLVGMVRDTNNKPMKNKSVLVCINDREMGTISTNNNGIWSYQIPPYQRLNDGFHIIQAYANLPVGMQATQTRLFQVQINKNKTLRSGNVNVENSGIVFPYDGDYINTTTPTIVGILADSQLNPVTGETVQVQINNVTIGTVTSDSNGIFSYVITDDQALSDGSYTVGSYCVQTDVYLTTNDFVVDTTPPAAPTIVFPTEGQTTSSPITVSGTTESDAMITTFLDADTFGDISYADDSGNWSIDYDLESGDHTVAAQATDLAGNTGDVSDTIDFTIE